MCRCGYSLRGIAPRDHRPLIRGIHYSAILVMSSEGIHDVCLVQGTVDGETFETRTHLMPVLQPFNWVDPFCVDCG